jgi:hypothetical protein
LCKAPNQEDTFMKMIAVGTLAFSLALTSSLTHPRAAYAWGDDGHKVVALIAQHHLAPAAKSQVDAMLAADTDNLTATAPGIRSLWMRSRGRRLRSQRNCSHRSLLNR